MTWKRFVEVSGRRITREALSWRVLERMKKVRCRDSIRRRAFVHRVREGGRLRMTGEKEMEWQELKS